MKPRRPYKKTIAWTMTPKRELTLWLITEIRKARVVVKFTENFLLNADQKALIKTLMFVAELKTRLEYVKRRALLQ
jgi:hypothetical protein